ncbi:hypothetical protein HAX54_013491, partial [Datura stramonium]|nr:hypothetical protein [Datura stramonium]
RLQTPLEHLFMFVVGGELIPKYLGDGPKLVFRVDDLSPSIFFIDASRYKKVYVWNLLLMLEFMIRPQFRVINSYVPPMKKFESQHLRPTYN